MLKITVLINMMLWSSISYGAAPSYKSIFKDKKVRVSKNANLPGYDAKGKEIRLDPLTHIPYANSLRGHIQLFELVRDGKIVSHPAYSQRVLSTLKNNYSDIDFASKDTLLALDVMGDLGGFFRQITEGMVNSKTLDLVGVEAHFITYRMEERSKGSQRLVIVIKENAKDYRELNDGETPLQNHTQISEWVASEVTDLFNKLFNSKAYHALENTETYEQTYKLLGKRPDIAEGQPRAWMPRTEFDPAFRTAFVELLRSLSGTDFLHLRPTLWNDKPVADATAVELFHYTIQRGGGSLDAFIENYTARSIEIRNRLYKIIHRRRRGRRGGNDGGGEYLASEHMPNTGRTGYEEPALTGAGAQVRFGEDFFSGGSHKNMSLAEMAKNLSGPIVNVVAKLERAGIVELSQLQNKNTAELVNGAADLSFKEIVELGLELSDHGIYMNYPSSIYFRLDSLSRLVISPPRNKKFGYSTRTNTYKPFKKDENQ